MKFFEDLMESSAKVADKVAKVTGEYIDKGKDKIDEMSLKNDLSKAQKQLGALVYALHKSGESNDELMNQYIEEIAEIERKLEEVRAEDKDEGTAVIDVEPEEVKELKYCPNCGQNVDEDDSFCKNCGNAVK